MAIGVRSYWAVLASVSLMVVGSLGPWAAGLGVRVDGRQDELVLGLAITAAGGIFFLAASKRSWLAVIPLLAGLTAAALTATDISDPADLSSGVSGNVHLNWGIYVGLFGSISLVVASVLLVVEMAHTRSTPRLLIGLGDVLRRLKTVRLGRRGDATLAIADARSARVARKAVQATAAAELKWRREFVRAASRVTPYLAVRKDGALFFISTSGGTSRFADVRRPWKEDRQLDRAMGALDLIGVDPTGSAFVDIGAHIGTSTIRALRRHGFSSALCFEPEPDNFQILRANLAANNLDGVAQAFNVALSNNEGGGYLRLKKSGSGSHELLPDAETGRPMVHAQTTSLDRLSEEGLVDPEDAGLLWIDVQGSELEVLEGSRTFLERSIPIVIEFTPSRFRAVDRVESFIHLLSSSHTHFADLKSPVSSTDDFKSLAAVAELSTRHKSQTDLLVVRLPFTASSAINSA